MLRRLVRALVKLGLVGAVVAVVAKALRRRQLEPLAPVTTGPWPPLDVAQEQPEPVVAEPVVAEPVAEWVSGEELVVAEPVVADELVSPAELVSGEELVSPAELVSWVEPDDEGACPESHPIKAKLASGVFHLPGMMHHERTKADRCYADAAAAEADGLRQAKR